MDREANTDDNAELTLPVESQERHVDNDLFTMIFCCRLRPLSKVTKDESEAMFEIMEKGSS